MILERPIDETFWTELGVEPHPVAPLPTPEWVAAHDDSELISFLLDRQEIIDRMRSNPLHHGWEPPIWRILDALCGFPWMEDTAENRAWSLRVRRKLLGQDQPAKVLLLNGGNRGGKSEWAASRVMRILLGKAGRRAWCFHQDQDMSRQYQQPLLYKYLPPELRTEKGFKQGKPTYISYKTQTGFSEEHFVLPNWSDCDFRFYAQDFKKIQGGEIDVAWCDELVPASWVKELKARVATRGGWLIITFTPVEGYTPTVKMFLDIACATVSSTAFVLPKDGKEALPELALAGEDPMKWLEDGVPAQPPVPEGREFERVPRIMACPTDRRQAVAFMTSFENPWGNPRELYELHKSDTMVYQKMKFYGVATKLVSGKFPRFRMQVHVIPRHRIPTVGTDYHVVDPCSGRNWAQIWARVNRAAIGRRIFITDEWPCPGKYVPGVGDMGNWAESGDKLDGEAGPAQRPLGWGLLRYRKEIDRIEGRETPREIIERIEGVETKFDKWDTEDEPPRPRAMTARSKRRPEDGRDVYMRIMDSRYGMSPSQTSEGQTTLIEQCAEEVDLEFVPASGKLIKEGVDLINNLLDYREEEPIGPMNEPRLFVCEECLNVIFALLTWTGEDGEDGACKDFIDVIRYLLLADPEDYSADRKEAA